MYEFEITGDEELVATFSHGGAIVDAETEEALRRSAYAVESEASRNVLRLFVLRSGNLLASIHSEVQGSQHATVGTNLVYAQLREKGGVVYPRVARFLSWMTATGRVFARRTVHIGRPYLSTALESMKGTIEGFFRDAADRIRGRLER